MISPSVPAMSAVVPNLPAKESAHASLAVLSSSGDTSVSRIRSTSWNSSVTAGAVTLVRMAPQAENGPAPRRKLNDDWAP